MKKKKVSCIIVSYKDTAHVQKCVASIPVDSAIEVIVADNTTDNRGFAKGCNVGASQAQGEYLFFLNPDTRLLPQTITKLVTALENDPTIGIIAPQLLNAEKKPYLSFTRQPRWYSTPIVFSFVNKIWPHNPISKWHFYQDTSLNTQLKLEAVSGAAFMISKELYTQIQGFDEQFFMYWEDYDICQKVTQQHKNIFYFPEAQCIHYGSGSSSEKKNTTKYFLDSRKYFFTKYFGPVYARLLEWWLQLPQL